MNAIIRKAVETKLKRMSIDWVSIESLEIVSAQKFIDMTVSLEGEEHPVDVTIHYVIEENHVVVGDLKASRPWIAKAMGFILEQQGGRYPIPSGMEGMAIRMVL